MSGLDEDSVARDLFYKQHGRECFDAWFDLPPPTKEAYRIEARAKLELARQQAEQGNLEPLRKLYPKIARFINNDDSGDG